MSENRLPDCPRCKGFGFGVKEGARAMACVYQACQSCCGTGVDGKTQHEWELLQTVPGSGRRCVRCGLTEPK